MQIRTQLSLLEDIILIYFQVTHWQHCKSLVWYPRISNATDFLTTMDTQLKQWAKLRTLLTVQSYRLGNSQHFSRYRWM